MTEKKIDAGAVVEKAESGKELTDAEQRAYDKAMAEAAAECGYTEFLYHGVTMYRALDNHDRTFETKREADAWVMQTRVARNLSGN